MKAFLSLFLCAVLAGCASTSPVVVPDTQMERPLPNMALCQQLSKLDSDTFEAVINKLAEVAALYKECASLNKEKGAWIERGRKTNTNQN